VAKLAHLPERLIGRADSILHGLTNGKRIISAPQNLGNSQCVAAFQAEIETLRAQIRLQAVRLEVLENIDYDELSPKKAFDLLWKLKFPDGTAGPQ